MQDKFRKAAILFTSLDADTADQLLERMDPEEAGQIRRAIMELDELGDQEQEHVLQDFLGDSSSAAAKHGWDGVELDLQHTTLNASPPPLGGDDQSHADNGRTTAGTTAGGESPGGDSANQADAVRLPDDPENGLPHFHFLTTAAPRQVADCLASEHPQTIAVVASHVPAERAAEIITHLPDRLQGTVLSRIGRLGATSPDVLRDIEAGLQSTFRDANFISSHDVQGESTLAAILQAAGSNQSQLQQALDNEQQPDRPQHREPRVHGGRRDPPAARPDVDRRRRPNHPPHKRPVSRQAKPAVSASSVSASSVSASSVSASSVSTSKTRAGKTPSGTIRGSAASHPASRGRTAADIPPPAETARLQMRFEQLAELTDEELALVLAGCQPDVAMLALAGAAPDLVRRVVAGLSRREAKLFQQRLESIGPIRLQDMERAQQYLAELAARMVESGKIQQSLSRRFAAAA